MYIDSTNNTVPSGELPVARLLQSNIEPLLKVRFSTIIDTLGNEATPLYVQDHVHSFGVTQW